MKREFLKSLGIEDKETIDKILDENSMDIGKAKGELDDVKAQLTKAQGDLTKKTTEYDELKESTKDYGDLQKKIDQLELDKSQLTTDNAQLKVDLNNKVTEMQKAHAIENCVRDAKAKNVKAVMALLDMEKITFDNNELKGATEQLDALKGGEDTSFLFGESQQAPSGTHFNNTPNNTGAGTPTPTTLASAVAKALSK